RGRARGQGHGARVRAVRRRAARLPQGGDDHALDRHGARLLPTRPGRRPPLTSRRMPVSQKPRKSRHKTPPAINRGRKRQSGLRRVIYTIVVSVVVGSMALLTVFSYQRAEQRQENASPTTNPQATTTTVLDPVGGIPCPRPEGEAR